MKTNGTENEVNQPKVDIEGWNLQGRVLRQIIQSDMLQKEYEDYMNPDFVPGLVISKEKLEKEKRCCKSVNQYYHLSRLRTRVEWYQSPKVYEACQKALLASEDFMTALQQTSFNSQHYGTQKIYK